MDLKQRIVLYSIGLIAGTILAYFFYGQRLTNAGWLPEQRIKQRLVATLIQARPHAQAQLDAWPSELRDVRQAIPSASVDIGGSKRTDDSIYYHVHAVVGGRDALLIVAVIRHPDKDTTATLWELRER